VVEITIGAYFVLVTLVNLLWLGTIAGRVSHEQPDLYGRLRGHPFAPEPTIILAQFAWLRFLYSGAYRRELEDPSLRRSCSWFLVWYSITTVPLVVALLAFVAFFVVRAA
jgi:hypothetical protein